MVLILIQDTGLQRAMQNFQKKWQNIFLKKQNRLLNLRYVKLNISKFLTILT